MRFQPFVLALLISSITPGGSNSQQRTFSPELWHKLDQNESIEVIVELNISWRPEGKLSKDEIGAQRRTLAAAQAELVSELAGTQFKIRSQFQHVPGIALQVGRDALSILEQSPRVVSVTENYIGRPLR